MSQERQSGFITNFSETYSGLSGGWTLVHAGSAETNAPNLTVFAQAESLCHSSLFKPLKMTLTTFTMIALPWPL